MQVTFNAFMESQGDSCGYVAWIESPRKFKMLVHGETPEETAAELVKSLKVSLSYQLGIDMEDFSHKEITEGDLAKELSDELSKTGRKELKFQFA